MPTGAMRRRTLGRPSRTLLVLSALGLLACSTDDTSTSDPCSLEREIERQCGAEARDCGRAADSAESRARIDACVVDALNGSGAFFAIYDRAGTDSQNARAICRGADGAVLRLAWDSDPSGGDQTGAVITATRCDGAMAMDPEADGALPLACASVIELGRVCE